MVPPMIDVLKGKRALVVDDIPVNVKIMTILLKGLGVEVTSAFNGEDALEDAPAGAYDMALIDIHLGGGMNGYELSEKLKELQNDMFILGVTGNRVTSEFLQDAKTKGLNHVLEKPVTKEGLIAVLEQEWPQ